MVKVSWTRRRLALKSRRRRHWPTAALPLYDGREVGVDRERAVGARGHDHGRGGALALAHGGAVAGEAHHVVDLGALLDAAVGEDVLGHGEEVALEQGEGALVLVRVRLVVAAGDEAHPQRVAGPVAAREQVAGAGGVVVQRGRRGAAGGGREQVVAVVEAAGHLRDRDAAQPPLRARRGGRVGAHQARLQDHVAVVVVQARVRGARLVADRGDAVERGHGGVDPVVRRVVEVGAGGAEVGAGGIAPHAVELEQALLGQAVAGALAAAAAGQGGEVVHQRRELLVVEEGAPGAGVRGQRPVHGRLEEAEVVVVAGIVDRPAGPRERARCPSAPARDSTRSTPPARRTPPSACAGSRW